MSAFVSVYLIQLTINERKHIT